MIEMVLTHADLGRVRFAHSPVRELVASLRTLRDPRRKHVYRSWLGSHGDRLANVDMELLTALSPVGPHAWDFLTPDLNRQRVELSDELEMIVATPPHLVRTELEEHSRGRVVPGPLRPLYQDPASYLPRVVEEMTAYWQAVVEPVWQQVLAVTMTDVAHRMGQFALGGVTNVLNGLHSEVTFKDGRLFINKAHHCLQRNDLTGTGVLLVPCAFTWPTLLVSCCGTEQPSLTYPPRGVALLGDGATYAGRAEPLGALLGRTRANILSLLGEPATTTRLASDLDVSPAAVSQHLKVLKDAGLASARRCGRSVLYQRTATATELLAAAVSSPGDLLPVGGAAPQTSRVIDAVPGARLRASAGAEHLTGG